jgi:hypothetical protein
MKKLMIAALIGAQLAAAQPALAVESDGSAERRMGMFGGLRVRLSFGGNAGAERLRAGLAFAPAMHSRLANGESRLRIGEGLELGFRGREPVRFSLAGQDLRRLSAQGNERAERRRGVPTGALIAGGIVLVAVAGVTWIALELEASDDND